MKVIIKILHIFMKHFVKRSLYFLLLKLIKLIVLSVSLATDLCSQTDSILKFIFVSHPRSEDQIHESIYSELAKIDFAQYDVRMLGGDLTYSTSKDSATLAYCDTHFDLDNPNTLWSFGNHDVQSGHRLLIKNFTGRESFYSYARDGVTFIVLDTELDASGFSRTFIRNSQLQMVKDVCDTIAESRVLILLHHRLLWMINSEYFKPMLTDSIAASSRTMDTTNFYADIYPLLQKVKNKGIRVLVFGGDKTKINIAHSPEDSITFYAARLASDLPDSINNVIVVEYNGKSKSINCNFVPLTQFVTSVEHGACVVPKRFMLYQNYPNPFNPTTEIGYQISEVSHVSLKVYDLLGREITTLVDEVKNAGMYAVKFDGSTLTSGVYFYRLVATTIPIEQAGKYVKTKKLLLL